MTTEENEFIGVSSRLTENLLIGLNVFKFENIDIYEKIILLCLWSHSGTDGQGAHPKVATICKETGLGKSKVCEAMAELEAKGYVRRMARYVANGPGKKATQTSNEYMLWFPGMAWPEESAPDEGGPPDGPGGVRNTDGGGSVIRTLRTCPY